ncbi:hypothetical protein RFI_08426 [Reticulomyxa filosa]|uniref:Uncharacterized protein n=1 Tax=Reticulomyxa filosa TaxID=46433 RepID=X6NSG7_RETFI|nr:hypothetical protein RFI_08426 [Reticulomyxa filosa]|eukprot:ETO28699.1 hypothetical protein RFI_08426 [Reticulomyxa filosa]
MLSFKLFKLYPLIVYLKKKKKKKRSFYETVDRLEDIVNTLMQSEQHKDDCFLQVAKFIVSWEKIAKHVSNATSIEKRYLTQLRKLTQNIWSFLTIKENPCQQEKVAMQSLSVVPESQRTHVYMAKHILHTVIQHMIWYINAHPLGYKSTCKSLFLSKAYWQELIANYSKLEEILSMKEKKQPPVANQNVMTHSVCQTVLSQVLKWFEDGLQQNDKKKMNAKAQRLSLFRWLIDHKKDIYTQTQLLQTQVVDNSHCTIQQKAWALEGIANVVMPFVDLERKTWNFEEYLEYVVNSNHKNPTLSQEDLFAFAQWVTQLYSYLMDKMKVLKLNEILNKK